MCVLRFRKYTFIFSTIVYCHIFHTAAIIYCYTNLLNRRKDILKRMNGKILSGRSPSSSANAKRADATSIAPPKPSSTRLPNDTVVSSLSDLRSVLSRQVRTKSRRLFFCMCDDSSTANIRLDQFRLGLSMDGIHARSADVQALFDELDVDGDGSTFTFLGTGADGITFTFLGCGDGVSFSS